MEHLFKSVFTAVKRCIYYVISIFITYCICCLIGIIMSQNGNNFALSYRDKIVGKALATSDASINYQKGRKLSAAISDFGGNLFLAAIPQTLLGLTIVFPYLTVPVQGWAGGIVSVDSEHRSRFKDFKSTFYYFFVLLLQFIPFSLAIGAGIKCGVDFYKNNRKTNWAIWNYKIQKASLADLGYIYILVVPLFFVASCFEFLSVWNV